MYHMNKMHPLDTPSGLTCYTCQKIFTQRDLIENHFKTVKHKLECRKLQKMDLVEMTDVQEEDNYRKRLFKRNNFTVKPYIRRDWNFKETKEIPLENRFPVTDPRILSLKHKLDEDTSNTDSKKMQKKQERKNFATTSQTTLDLPTEISTVHMENTPYQGVTLHVSDIELHLFPEPVLVNNLIKKKIVMRQNQEKCI